MPRLLRVKKVLFFSLEMSKEQLAQRILATEARIEKFKNEERAIFRPKSGSELPRVPMRFQRRSYILTIRQI